MTLQPEIKDRLVEEFRGLLEQCDDLEGSGDPVDLRTLLSELAALRSEVRLEARQFKSALDELRAASEQLRAENERLIRDAEFSRQQLAAIRQQTERQMLLEVLELRDRVEAGVAAGRSHRPTWRSRWFARKDVRYTRALVEGLSLILNRMDRLLDAYRVRPIEVLNRPLDPQRMNAVGVRAERSLEDGIVLAEQRRGFTRDGDLLRCAEVIVNKRKATL